MQCVQSCLYFLDGVEPGRSHQVDGVLRAGERINSPTAMGPTPRDNVHAHRQAVGGNGQPSAEDGTRQSPTGNGVCQPAAVDGANRTSGSPAPGSASQQTARSHQSGGIETVVAQVLEKMVKDPKYSHYEFENQLRKQRDKVDLARVTNKDGLNILNMCVVNGRSTFLAPLMRHDCLLRLYDVPVSLDIRSQYGGCTTRRIAEMRKSSRMVADLEFYHDWEASLKPLMKAARSGNVDDVKTILREFSDQRQSKDSMNCNVAYWSCVGGNLEVLTAVIDVGVNLHNINKIGETLMHVVCKMGHANLVETLMRRRLPIDLSIRDGSDKVAVEYAAECGCIQVMQMLSIFGVELPPSVLPLSAYNDRRQMLHYLVEEYHMSIESTDGQHRTALMRAVEEKRADCFTYLLSRRPDLTKVDRRMRNILHYAAESGDENIMKTLLEKLTAGGLLSRLIDAQDAYVIAHQSYVVRGRDRGRHAWHYVEVNRELISVFLQKTRAGNIDVAHFGRVVKSGWGNDQERDIIKRVEAFLEENGENRDQPPDMTPLQLAIYRSHPAVAKMLLEAGASVNVTDACGLNTLHLAAMRGDLQTACLLDARGVDFELVSRRGKRPLDVAEDNGQDALMNFLEGRQYEALAKVNYDNRETRSRISLGRGCISLETCSLKL